MTDRKTIETTVQQVADGEITLQQATERLLALDEESLARVERPFAGARETEPELLPSLIDRLGTPPIDIVDRWCEEIRESLQTSPRSIEGIQTADFKLTDFEVTSSGQLRFASESEKSDLIDAHSVFSSEQIDRFVNALRHRLVGTQDSITQEALSRPAIRGASVPADIQEADSSSWSKVAMVAGIVLCAGVMFWILHANSTAEIAESDTSTKVSRPGASGNVFAEFPSTRSRPSEGGDDGFLGNDLFAAIDNNLASDDSPSNSLETLQSLEQTSDEKIAMLEADAVPQFSLEDLMPGVQDPGAEGAEESQAEPAMQTQLESESVTDKDGVSPINESESDPDVLSDDLLDGDQPDELQQSTHSVVSKSIELPPIDQTDPKDISDQFPKTSAPEKLTLEFPYPLEMSLQRRENGNGWNIVQDNTFESLAKLEAVENVLTFAWVKDAEKISSSRSLHHGRIKCGDGSAFFLRPEIEAESWRIRMDQTDMRPTWDLGAPLPPGVTRLSVEIGLPEEMEMTWVEPIPVDSPRRARGLAILKTLDSESVDLAIKFDVRCSRKMSCRLRYAARLDSSMPWQLVSRDLLEQFANQLAGRQELVGREADRLQNVYDMAGTRGKRIIRIKQKYNNGLADSLRQYAERVAELESLIAKVESNAAIHFRIWVLWPSGDQQNVFVSKL